MTSGYGEIQEEIMGTYWKISAYLGLNYHYLPLNLDLMGYHGK